MAQSGTEEGLRSEIATREPLDQAQVGGDGLIEVPLILKKVGQLPLGIIGQGVLGTGGEELAVGVHGELFVVDQEPGPGDLQPGLADECALGEILYQSSQFVDG